RALAGRIAAALAEPVSLDGLPLDVSGSIGVAVFPEHGDDFATLMRHADVAMYDAKSRGDVLAVYAPESDHNSPERRSLLADPRRVLVTLRRLDRLGVALSLDDFGTGYSSMQHLRRLPLAEVKIDRSFVLGMTEDPDDEAIVRSIIELAGALGLRVVAEGVEDEATWRLLLAAGCHVAQ